MDFSQSLAFPGAKDIVTISPFMPQSITLPCDVDLTSEVWPELNLAILIPFRISAPMTVINMFVYNGAAVSGNIDLGIYDVAGTRIISKGSTAQSGVNQIQKVAISSTNIGPGLFYMALAINNTTATTIQYAMSVDRQMWVGTTHVSSAFVLPANVTFGNVAYSYVPIFGLSSRSVV